MSRFTILALVCGVTSTAAAQQAGTTALLTVADTSIFAPLTLPASTTVRTASGAPGAGYWQNRADYDIAATLDTATKVSPR